MKHVLLAYETLRSASVMPPHTERFCLQCSLCGFAYIIRLGYTTERLLGSKVALSVFLKDTATRYGGTGGGANRPHPRDGDVEELQ